MKLPILLLALLGAVPAPALAQNNIEPMGGRPCRDDMFFVDVPLASKRPWSKLTHLEAVRAGLQAKAVDWYATWFCGPEDAVCAHAQNPRVELEVVLPQRAGGVRADGHCEVKPELRCVWVKAVERSRKLTWPEEIHDLRPPVDNRLEGSSSWKNYVTGRDKQTPEGWHVEA